MDLEAAVNGRKIAVRWLDLNKELAYHHNAVLRALQLKMTDDGWLAVVKVTIDASPKVCFVWGPSYTEVIEMLTWYVSNVDIPWKVDKYPAK